MLTAWYSSTASAHKTKFDWESKILDRRIEIIEKMTRLMGRQPGIQDEWKRYLQPTDKAQSPPRASSERLADYSADYVSTILLAKLYFGQKTIDAVNALSSAESPWWMKSESEQLDVLAAMSEELKVGLPTFTQTLTNYSDHR